jgi:hypothetical protein
MNCGRSRRPGLGTATPARGAAADNRESLHSTCAAEMKEARRRDARPERAAEGAQNGLTITSTTMPIMSTVGTSFMMR